ncbi:hypothetical protein ACIPEL_36125 [Streptomyces griseoviridis]
MDQATAPAPTASTPPPDDSFQHAATVAAEFIGPLTRMPSSVRLELNWPTGWGIICAFLSDQIAGLDEIATALDAPITTAHTGDEIHLESCARVHGVEIRAFALISRAQYAELQGQPTQVLGEPGETPPEAPALIHVPAAHTEDQDGGE